MSSRNHFRYVPSLEKAQEILIDLEDVVNNNTLQPFVMSRLKRHELLLLLKGVKHGIFGFDQTLHKSSQWTEIKKILGPEAQNIWQTNLDNKPINGRTVINGNEQKNKALHMSKSQQTIAEQSILQTGWTSRLIHFMKEKELTQEQIKTVAQFLPIRPGTKEIFQLLRKTAVISWGFKDVIENWLKINQISQEFAHDSTRLLAIGATKLEYDSEEKVIDYDLESIVINANKASVANRFLDTFGIQEGLTLALGDSVYDVDMMPYIDMGQDSYISGVNILILPPKFALAHLNEFKNHQLNRLWQKITCLLIADDFYPLLDLMTEAQTFVLPPRKITKKAISL